MEAAGEFGTRPLYKTLGYFSIIGLLRVHCLLGDYVLALKMMDNIVLNKKAMFARVTACHVTTYYYVGFAYMMMRRYADAIKAFSTILSFIQRTKQYHSRSYQFDQVKFLKRRNLTSQATYMSPYKDRKEGWSNVRLAGHVHCPVPHPSWWKHPLTAPWKIWRADFQNAKGVMIVAIVLLSVNRAILIIFLIYSEEGLPVFEELFQYACPKFIAASGRENAPANMPRVVSTLGGKKKRERKKLFIDWKKMRFCK